MRIDLTSAAEIGDGRQETGRLFPVWLSPVFLGLLILLGNLSFSQASDEKLFAMVQAVSAKRIERDINMLVGFGTRHSLSDTRSQDRGIGAARRWTLRVSQAA